MNASLKTLAAAGLISLVVAVFQAVISFSPSLSIYFGAPEEIAASPGLLLALGLAAAVIFVIFGLYGLSGAGLIRRLPWLKAGLVVTGAIYTLRGLAIIPVALIKLGILNAGAPMPGPAVASSLIPLVIGVLYLAGTAGAWRRLSTA